MASSSSVSSAVSTLGGGIDTGAIVDQLMAIQQKSVTAVENKQFKVQLKASNLTDIQTKMVALKAAATTLSGKDLWNNTQTVTSSDATKITVASTGAGASGGTSIDVLQLARSAQRSYSFTPAPDVSSMTIDGATISLPANATVDDVISTINNATAVDVYAAKVTNSDGTNSLVFSQRTTGAAKDIVASASTLVEDPDKARAGQDAQYKLDGSPTVRTSASNMLTDVMAGAKITLKGVTTAGSPVTVYADAPGVDKDKAKTAVKAFVDAYNEMVDLVNTDVTEKRDPTAEVGSDAWYAGTLYGDSTLTGMLGSFRSLMQETVDGTGNTNYDTLQELGISTGKSTGATSKDQLLGKLVIEDSKLDDALSTDPTSVKRMFGGLSGGGGIMGDVTSLIRKYTGTTNSALDVAITATKGTVSDFQDQITRLTSRMDAEKTRLNAQFSAMNTAIAQMNSNLSSLQGLMGNNDN